MPQAVSLFPSAPADIASAVFGELRENTAAVIAAATNRLVHKIEPMSVKRLLPYEGNFDEHALMGILGKRFFPAYKKFLDPRKRFEISQCAEKEAAATLNGQLGKLSLHPTIRLARQNLQATICFLHATKHADTASHDVLQGLFELMIATPVLGVNPTNPTSWLLLTS